MQFAKFIGSLALFDFGEHEEFVVIGFAKVDPFDRAWINHWGLIAKVNILGFVNMSQGHIIEARIFDKSARQDQVFAQHNGPFVAVDRALNGAVGGQNSRDSRVQLVEPLGEHVADAIFQLLVELVGVFAGKLQRCHQPGTEDPRQTQDLHWQSLEVGRFEEDRFIDDVNMRYCQSGKFLKGMGAPSGRAEIMIANQQNRRNACSRKAHHASTPFTLKGGGRSAVFVGIACKDNHIHFFRDSGIHNCIE